MESEQRATRSGEELLPSILYAQFRSSSRDAPLDHECLLLELLSVLSSLEDIVPINCASRRRDFDVVAWIFQGITKEESSTIDIDYGGGDCKEDSFLYEWSAALKYIYDLLPNITPVELHVIASQSIFLSEGATASHRALCLLLCSRSLQQCRIEQQKRWKRWQSLVCETIRIFQDSIPILTSDDRDVDTEMPAFSLLVNYIIPSCLHVIDQLPSKNPYHVAIFSGLTGTSSNILEIIFGRCLEDLSNGKEEPDRVFSRFTESQGIIHHTIQSIISSFDRFGDCSENSLWIEPMRKLGETEFNRNEDVDFFLHRDSLSWWARHRCNHEPEERIANMDTSINETGLGLLAMKSFYERPMVYHPNFVWTIWLPHAVVLIRKSAMCPFLLQNLGFEFLRSLLEVVPEESLVQERKVCSTTDAHLELFELLSNQLMSRVQMTTPAENSEENKCNISATESEFKLRSQRTVVLMKTLLTRFTTVNQVQIVEKLMQTCSTPGLRARYLDLLRPLMVIQDDATVKILWKLLMSILNDLFEKYWNRRDQVLNDIDDLISNDVEIAVGVISMIQMLSLVKGKEFPDDPRKVGENLLGFRMALQKLLDRWSEDISVAPEFHYRLFLLDNALQSTYESLAKK